MSFPVDDAYWAAALRFLEPLAGVGDRITGPDEFRDGLRGPAFYSYGSLAYLKPDLQWAVIHKGMIEEIGTGVLRDLFARLSPVFANEVFVILAARPGLDPVDPASPHLAALIGRLAARPPAAVPDAPRVSDGEDGGSGRPDVAHADLIRRGILSSVFQSDQEMITATVRETTQRSYVGDGVVLCRVLGKYLMYVAGIDTGISPHLIMDGYWEIWNTVAMRNVLRAGMHCIDVGANHGYYSLIMADLAGPGGRVLAVEPHPGTAALLTRTRDVNGFTTRIQIVQKAAAGDNGRQVPLFVLKDLPYTNATLRDDLLKGRGEAAAQVETATLDALTARWPRVDLVKIDAEGAEEDIWRGMQGCIERNPSLIIIMEFMLNRYADGRAFLEEIARLYPVRQIGVDGRVVDLDVERYLAEAPLDDVMLFLQRPQA